MIIWLVGLSGSGKTTIGREMYRLWKPVAPNTVIVDGDDIRRILRHNTDPQDYTLLGRYDNARRIVEICSWLDKQGINVICCILCLFDDIMLNNRQHFSEYFQVFIDAPLKLLEERDPKGLYYRALRGEEKNVVGIDIPFPIPQNSDLILNMNNDFPSPEKLAEYILKKAGVLP